METSLEIKNIAAALQIFHDEVTPIVKDATNPHFKSKFASLDNIISHIADPLEEANLSFVQLPDGDGLTTIIMHGPSGEWIKATANLHLDKNTPQGQGSAITYMRRYALSAALGLATEDDDDGNEASKAPVAQQKATTVTKKADPVLRDKAKIMQLLKELNEEQTATNILFLTQLSVEDPANLPDIIGRLEALIEERSQR